jgi:hypothetical protein
MYIHSFIKTKSKNFPRALERIFRKEDGPGNYKTSNKYWYNFGEFDYKGDWIVNKPLIVERLMKEAEEKALDWKKRKH